MAIEKLKSHKSPAIDQFLTVFIKAGGRTIRCQIHKLIYSIWNKEELPEEWKELIMVPISRMIKQIVVIIQAYHCYLLHTKLYQTSSCQG